MTIFRQACLFIGLSLAFGAILFVALTLVRAGAALLAGAVL